MASTQRGRRANWAGTVDRMDDQDFNNPRDSIQSDAQVLYSRAAWRGISCLSSFWPYTGTEDVFEVRRAISNCAAGVRQTYESVSPLAGIGSDMVEAEDVLHFVGAANSVLKAADSALDELVAEAIARGATWAQVGKVLGVRRQAAHNRFSKGISARRRFEIEREGIASMTLFTILAQAEEIESKFGFTEEDWESTPVEVFIDHAVQCAVRVTEMFLNAVRALSDGESERFMENVIRAYRTLNESVRVLSLPRCLAVIVKHSLDDMTTYPWLDSNAPVYYIELVTCLRLAFQHFDSLISVFKTDDGGLSVRRQIAYVYDNLRKAARILWRPELMNTMGRIDDAILKSGNAVFVPGDPSKRRDDRPELTDVIKLYWKKDWDGIAEMVGVDTLQRDPSLDELLGDTE